MQTVSVQLMVLHMAGTAISLLTFRNAIMVYSIFYSEALEIASPLFFKEPIIIMQHSKLQRCILYYSPSPGYSIQAKIDNVSHCPHGVFHFVQPPRRFLSTVNPSCQCSSWGWHHLWSIVQYLSAEKGIHGQRLLPGGKVEEPLRRR